MMPSVSLGSIPEHITVGSVLDPYGAFLMVDLFSGASADLSGRVPDKSSVGATWAYSGGATWATDGSGAISTGGTIAGNDDEAYIDVGTPNQDISATVNADANDITVLVAR